MNNTHRTKKICISFDFHNDSRYRYLLTALKENESSLIDFEDLTPGEINSSDVGRVKASLSQKIGDSTHLLVIVGEHANELHSDYLLIGDRNWQWWEINKAKSLGKKLIAVKINSTNLSPDPLLNSGTSWAMSFTVDKILKGINE
ncbi:MAG: TIR domain-containing protein [Thermomicrobiales bacterium]|nr:TIR domain-containing protein [Thermomicrobiales bacterium]